MNTSYRSVWNHALGAWVAVSEVTRSRGKRSGSTVAIVAAALIGGLGATGALAQATSYGATGTYPNPINASGGVTLTVAPTAVADQTGLISDFTTAGGIVKDGTGTLQLSNTGNSYVGVTSIAAGILRISSDLALGNAANGLQLNGGTLQFGAGGVTSARAITVSAGGGSIDVNDAFANVLSGGFAGSGALALVNLGTSPSETTRLTLSGSSAGFTGTTQVGRNDVPNVPASGRINVAITSNGALGTGNNAVNIYNNGELDFTGTGVTAGNLQIQTLRSTNTLGTNSGVTFAAGASAGNATISSNAAGALIDFQTGTTAATSTLNNSGGGRIYFEGNSTGGTATINNTDGRLYVQGTADLSGATVNNAVGGSVYISDSTTGVAVGRLSGAGNVVLGGKTLTVGAASILGNSDTISGVISDLGKQFKDLNGNGYNNAATATGGSVVKVGAGTLALTGANTYSGGTGITAGTLAFNNAQALGTGAVVMTGGELLATNDVAFGDALQSITFNGSATVAAATGETFYFHGWHHEQGIGRDLRQRDRQRRGAVHACVRHNDQRGEPERGRRHTARRRRHRPQRSDLDQCIDDGSQGRNARSQQFQHERCQPARCWNGTDGHGRFQGADGQRWQLRWLDSGRRQPHQEHCRDPRPVGHQHVHRRDHGQRRCLARRCCQCAAGRHSPHGGQRSHFGSQQPGANHRFPGRRRGQRCHARQRSAHDRWQQQQHGLQRCDLGHRFAGEDRHRHLHARRR